MTKASTYDFYRALEKSTNSTGVNTPKSRYKALLRTVLQWRESWRPPCSQPLGSRWDEWRRWWYHRSRGLSPSPCPCVAAWTEDASLRLPSKRTAPISLIRLARGSSGSLTSAWTFHPVFIKCRTTPFPWLPVALKTSAVFGILLELHRCCLVLVSRMTLLTLEYILSVELDALHSR